MVQKIFLLICLITALSATVFAQVSPVKENSEYRVGAGDLLDVRVLLQPDLSGRVRISENGLISLPFIGEIKVNAQTLTDLTETLRQALKKVLLDPQVTVQIEEYASQQVTVLGAVTRPGRYQLRRPERLLDILGISGGTTERASRFVYLIHPNPLPITTNPPPDTLADNENFETIDIDLLLRGQVELNRNINNGDVVFVPEADLVFFTGNVNKPGTLVMRVPVPLSQALAMAGGLSNGAAKDRIRIFRTQAGSTKRREISANLDAIMKSSAEDPLLQANDLIFVPDATGRNAGITVLKTFTGALSLSLGAAILR